MADNAAVKKLWGTEFPIVAKGLSEKEVVSFVEKLMDQSRETQTDHDRQSSLLKLAEQTVVEADRLAETIKGDARKEAEEEGARIITEAQAQAKEQAGRQLQKAERDAKNKSASIVAEAEQDAKDAVDRAKKEGQDFLDATKEKVASMESEVKLEAEYIVRRFAVKFVDEIRTAVTGATNNMLPSLEALVREAGDEAAIGGNGDAQPAIAPSGRRSKSSAKR